MNIVGCYCVLNILLPICVFNIEILKRGVNFSRYLVLIYTGVGGEGATSRCRLGLWVISG